MSHSMEFKPHAVLIPFPVQGHINPLFKLAKLLHLRGFHITFVNTEYNHKRLLNSKGPNALNGFHDFHFETIPDGLPSMDDDDGDVTQDVVALLQSTRTNFLNPFRNLLARLNGSSALDGVIPPVTCLVCDATMTFTIQAAQEFQLPIVLLWPASAFSLLSVMHFRTLLDKGLIPLQDESYMINGYLDTKLNFIQGMQNFRLKDQVDYIRTTNPNDSMLKLSIEMVDEIHRSAPTIVFNTSHELESDALNALSFMFPSLYTIGPFPSFLNQSPQNHLPPLCTSTSLWEEDIECLEWLESNEPRSVVYVNFGSITVMSPEQLLEFAWGLANSKKPFLWIIRPDLVIGGSVILSPEFVNETRDRGLIAKWCPQEKVLNHGSVGVFLTHCGWNSTSESICSGVPMLCWPFFADQPTNCRYICNEWCIGMEIEKNVKRDEVENVVNEVIVREKGKKMREKVMKLKKNAEKDTGIGGTSYNNLDKVIKEVLLKSK